MEKRNELSVIKKTSFLGKHFVVYGTIENPLFLAKDVAEWIEHSNTASMLQSIDEDEKVLNNVYTLGGNQNSWFLTENGVYEVLMLSRKPIAKVFKKKVKEILRDIRLTGGHIENSSEFVESYFGDLDYNVKYFIKVTLDSKKKLLDENNKQKKLLDIQKPKVDFYDSVTKSQNTLTMRDVAILLNMGIGRNRLFSILRNCNVLDKNNIPYQTYVNRGYFRTNESKYLQEDGSVNINIKTVVFQKGVEFIRKTVLNYGKKRKDKD